MYKDNEGLLDKTKQVVQSQFPERVIKSVEDKGVWMKHIFKTTFADETCVYVKLAVNSDSDVLMEANAIDLLHKNGIQQPGVVQIDASCKIMPYPYIIQEGGEGKSLGYYLTEGDTDKLKRIYRAVGEYYSRLANIANSWAGVWDVVPEKKKYPLHPAQAMYHLEIEQGSGYKAYTSGAITQEQYEKIKAVWQMHLPMLKERPVSLVHYSPFPWTIYITNAGSDYSVSKITALGDIVWWDADVAAAHILYPPFFIIDDSLRGAFLEGYKKVVNMQCISLYCIIHRLCAWAGIYAEPHYTTNSSWRRNCIKDIDSFLMYCYESYFEGYE